MKSYARTIAPDPINREKDDFYPTPPEGTRALLAVEEFDGTIWEPAAGDGAISIVLEAAGHKVISSDLVDRGYCAAGVDFLMEWQPRAPNIITNPPFKLADQFVEKALELTTAKVAILARLAYLEGIRRKEMFERTRLSRVWVFSRRLQIKRRGDKSIGGSMIAFAWFVWERDSVPWPPPVGFIDWEFPNKPPHASIDPVIRKA